ncbi:hypothetical protein KKB55_17835 [Myxococcota bacterium]|nr:hypothetical protein [Myxococcota bacterium]MBU1899606.1 hypothetical protein [Myxococcota bacterium]
MRPTRLLAPLFLLAPLLLLAACDDDDGGAQAPIYFDASITPRADAAPRLDAQGPRLDAAPTLDAALMPDAAQLDGAPVSDAAQPDAAPVEGWIESFARQAAAAECARQKACIGEAGLALSPYDSCTPGQQARRALDLAWMAEAWTSEALWATHPEHADACLEALKTLPCRLLDQGFPPACRALFEGRLPTGAHCVMDEVCAGGGFCDIVDPCFGECQPRRPTGGACLSNRDCEWGLSCVLGVCGAPQPLDGACMWSEACDEGLFCLLGEGVEGTCRPISEQFTRGVGETCEMYVGGRACQLGLACVLGSGDDSECVVPGGLGQRCVIGTPNPCGEGLYCKFGDDIYNGRCEAIPALGQRCEPDEFSEPCGYEAGCINGRCQALKPLGAACVVDEECAAFDCVSGRCEYGFACD